MTMRSCCGRHLVVLATALLGACDGSGVATTAGARGPADAVRVTTVAVRSLSLPETLAVTGTLAPQEEVVLGFQVPGRLTELPVDVGDAVGAGELLAALDVGDFRLGIERARAALTSSRVRLGLPAADESAVVDVETAAPVREARAVLEEASLSLDRQRELVQKSLRSQAELDAAQAAVAVAASRLQGARDQVRTWLAEYGERQVDLAVAEKRARDAVLQAPWACRVAARQVAAGSYVAVGAPVLTIVRVDALRLRLRVPERLASSVAMQQRVEFTVDGVTAAAPAVGIVTRLGAAISADDRTLLVEASVDNATGALRPGAFCRAQIVVVAERPVPAVPASAVQSFAGIDRAFTVVDGVAVERRLDLGRRRGDLIEVRAGLDGVDRVVDTPHGLVDGTRVAVDG